MTVTSISILVFCISLGLLFYTYIGYGLLAGFVGLFRRKHTSSVHNKNIPVTIIVPAYNEAIILPQKVKNTLDGLENFINAQVIVITDGSDDGSKDLRFADARVLHLHQPERLGKSAAINKAMLYATGEIVVITDANAMVNRPAFEILVAKFDHSKIGAVSGEKKVHSADGSTGGEGFYWQYESFLKKCSAAMYSLTGAAGELIALRKNIFRPIPSDTILDDLQLSLDIIRQKKRIDYAPAAFASELPSKSLADEFQRKVRISAGVFQTLSRNPFVFNPFQHSLFVFQFFSHRILRWMVSIPCLLVLLISNFILCFKNMPENIYFFFQVFFILQLTFYVMVLFGFILRNQKLPGFLFIPFYFILMNVSVVIGFKRFLQKKESVMWKKAKR